jgi:hypothetical protein
MHSRERCGAFWPLGRVAIRTGEGQTKRLPLARLRLRWRLGYFWMGLFSRQRVLGEWEIYL